MTPADIIFGTLLALVVPGIVICALGIIAVAIERWERKEYDREAGYEVEFK